MIKFTFEDLCKLSPCEEGLEWARAQTDAASAWEVCPHGNWLLWLLCQIQPLTKEQAVRIAIECARRVLPNFVVVRPYYDTRPQQAIEAAEVWLHSPSSETHSAATMAVGPAMSTVQFAAQRTAEMFSAEPELYAIWQSAWLAALSACHTVKSAVACNAETAALQAGYAAQYAAESAAWIMTKDTVSDNAWDEVRHEAASVVWTQQADIIRRIVKNPFLEA